MCYYLRILTLETIHVRTVTAMSEGDRRIEGDAPGCGLEKEFMSFRALTAEICSSTVGNDYILIPYQYQKELHEQLGSSTNAMLVLYCLTVVVLSYV